LIENTLRKNQVQLDQLKENNRNYQSLLAKCKNKDELISIKINVINDILSKATFPIPPQEDDFPPHSPPQPNPNPEDNNLKYLGSTERERILNSYQLFSNKPN
jgi:hypothetical protein